MSQEQPYQMQCPHCGQTIPVHVGVAKEAYPEATIGLSLDDVKTTFSKEISDMLTFSEEQDRFVLKPKRFLGKDNFRIVAKTARNMGGEYVSAKKDSYFWVPKTAKAQV